MPSKKPTKKNTSSKRYPVVQTRDGYSRYELRPEGFITPETKGGGVLRRKASASEWRKLFRDLDSRPMGHHYYGLKTHYLNDKGTRADGSPGITFSAHYESGVLWIGCNDFGKSTVAKIRKWAFSSAAATNRKNKSSRRAK